MELQKGRSVRKYPEKGVEASEKSRWDEHDVGARNVLDYMSIV